MNQQTAAVKERLLPLAGEMILAYQQGRKSMTRRVVVPQPNEVWSKPPLTVEDDFWTSHGCQSDVRCPYGKPGDILAFQEAYQIRAFIGNDPERRVSGVYLADGAEFNHVQLTPAEWAKLCARKCPMRPTPGRFMYRSLVRYRSPLLAVGVERVQDISEQDAIVEGIAFLGDTKMGQIYRRYDREDNDAARATTYPRLSFETLWDRINKKRGYGWEKNVWTWVLTFQEHQS